MVLVTTTIGFLMAGSPEGGLARWLLLAVTLAGTGMAAAGSAVLNNYLERDADARMTRTRGRALPSGAVDPAAALAYGVVLVLGGVALMATRVNLLAGFLVLLTSFLYVLVYTPLKKLTWLNTPIGAIPGALPPVIGWAAADGTAGLGAWALFAILFAWQHPHFYSIAWMFRDDYAGAGFKMLSVVDPSGRRLFRQSLAFAAALIALSMTLPAMGAAGPIYAAGAAVAGLILLAACIALVRSQTRRAARRVLLASVLYLPALLALIVVDAALLR
jgi:protoheme IX farnesyltransferase